MHIRHIAENITHPMVGTRIAKSIPRPIQNARKPSSFFFFKKLNMTPPILLVKKFYTDYIKKQLYSRYPIIAITAATTRYHRNTGKNLEIINIDSIMHKPPAYFLHVYLITGPPNM